MEVTCPECGGAFDSGPSTGTATCSRCGSTFSLEAAAMTQALSSPALAPGGEMPQSVGCSGGPAAEPPPDQLIGRELGGCVIEKVIGRGGMGVVFMATHKTLELPVAVKVLPSFFAESNETAVRRFMREARATAKLRHENVVSVHDAGVEGGTYYIVMEYVSGGSLQDILGDDEAMPVDRAVDIICQVCEALQYAHGRGVIHRDIKPANIMLDKSGTVKLADLGLAKNTDDGSALTLTGAIVGTPLYMAPEQIGSRRDVDHRTDIYALGCTLYRMVCGQVPYDGNTTYQILEKHLYEPAPEPTLANPDIPREVAAVIRSMMAKGPSGRPSSAIKAAENLRRAMEKAKNAPPREKRPRKDAQKKLPLVLEATPGPSAGRRASTKRTTAVRRRRTRPALVAAGALFIAAILAASWYLRHIEHRLQADWQAASAVALDPGVSLQERILALEAFLEKHPSGILGEEARRQAALRRRDIDRRKLADKQADAQERKRQLVTDARKRVAEGIDQARRCYDLDRIPRARAVLGEIRDLAAGDEKMVIDGLLGRIETRQARIADHKAWLAEHAKRLAAPGLGIDDRILLLAEEYEKDRQLIEQYPNDPYVNALQLPLVVKASPAGCAVYAGGRLRGSTPVLLRYWLGAELVLTVKKPGYETKKRKIRFHPSVEVDVTLVKTSVWSADLGSPVHGRPAVSGGKLVVGCRDGRIVALDASTGKRLWDERPPGTLQFEGPVTVHGDRAYLASTAGHLFAVSLENGKVAWDCALGGAVRGGVAVARVTLLNNRPTVFAGCDDGRTYCVDAATGKVNRGWAAQSARAPIRGRPLVVDRTMYVADADGGVRAHDVTTGRLLDRMRTPGILGGSPVRAGGWICVGTDSGIFCCFGLERGRRGSWRFPTDADVASTPAAAGAVAYFGTTKGTLYAVDFSTGTEKWTFRAGSAVYGTPAVGPSRVYFGCANASVYAIDRATGALAWRYPAPYEIRAGLVYDEDLVFVASSNGKIVAITDE